MGAKQEGKGKCRKRESRVRSICCCSRDLHLPGNVALGETRGPQLQGGALTSPIAYPGVPTGLRKDQKGRLRLFIRRYYGGERGEAGKEGETDGETRDFSLAVWKSLQKSQTRISPSGPPTRRREKFLLCKHELVGVRLRDAYVLGRIKPQKRLE